MTVTRSILASSLLIASLARGQETPAVENPVKLPCPSVSEDLKRHAGHGQAAPAGQKVAADGGSCSGEVVAPENPKKEGVSVLPFFAANSTWGLLVGGGVFSLFPDQDLASKDYQRFDAWVVFTTNQGEKFGHIKYGQRIGDYSFSFLGRYTDFFEPHYGYKVQIVPEPEQLQNFKFRHYALFTSHLTEKVEASLFAHQKFRKEYEEIIDTLGQTRTERKYADENTVMIGTILGYKDLHNTFAPVGSSAELTLATMPSGPFTSLSDQDPYHQIELDLRYHHELHSRVILSTLFLNAFTIGSPSPVFSYFLGGGSWLRGYRSLRYRGKRQHIGIVEPRVQVWRMISVVGFSEVGVLGGSIQKEAMYSHGVGVRVGLPPNYVEKVRLDVGFGTDGVNLSLEFGESF